jgi:hypothetical protein
MFGREANKLCKSGLPVPLWDLLSILETRTKNKDRASLYVSTLDVGVVGLGLGKNFEWS